VSNDHPTSKDHPAREGRAGFRGPACFSQFVSGDLRPPGNDNAAPGPPVKSLVTGEAYRLAGRGGYDVLAEALYELRRETGGTYCWRSWVVRRRGGRAPYECAIGFPDRGLFIAAPAAWRARPPAARRFAPLCGEVTAQIPHYADLRPRPGRETALTVRDVEAYAVPSDQPSPGEPAAFWFRETFKRAPAGEAVAYPKTLCLLVTPVVATPVVGATPDDGPHQEK